MGQWKRHYQGKAAEIAALDRLAQDNVAMAADAKAEALAFETDLAAAKQRAERAEDSAATATQSLHEAVRIIYVLHYTTVRDTFWSSAHWQSVCFLLKHAYLGMKHANCFSEVFFLRSSFCGLLDCSCFP